MPCTARTESEISPDKPVSTGLLSKVKDNFDDHEARIGSSGGGTAGGIGEVLNGSFEVDSDLDGVPDNWERYNYAGGSSAIDPVDKIHGKRSFRFVHPGQINQGGGWIQSSYSAVSNLYIPPFRFAYKATAAGVKVKVISRYYGEDGNGDPGTFIGEYTLMESVANPLIWSAVRIVNLPFPFDTAKYVKYRLVGGETDTPVAATINFDGVGATFNAAKRKTVDTINLPYAYFYGGWSAWYQFGATYNLTIPNPNLYRWVRIYCDMLGWGGSSESGTISYNSNFRASIGVGSNTIYGTTDIK